MVTKQTKTSGTPEQRSSSNKNFSDLLGELPPEQKGLIVKRNEITGEIMYVVDKHGHMYFPKEVRKALLYRRAHPRHELGYIPP